MALGPFSGSRPMLRTLLSACLGLLIALAVSPLAGLLLAGVATALSLLQVEGESLWDLGSDALRFHLRRAFVTRDGNGPALSLRASGDMLHDAEGGLWAAWELPPRPVFGRDPEVLLEEARALLRLLPGTAGEAFLARVAFPWPEPPVTPPPEPKERAPFLAYRKLQEGLRRGRYQSRLFLILPARMLVEAASGEGAGTVHPPSSWTRVRGRELQGVARSLTGPWGPRPGSPDGPAPGSIGPKASTDGPLTPWR